MSNIESEQPVVKCHMENTGTEYVRIGENTGNPRMVEVLRRECGDLALRTCIVFYVINSGLDVEYGSLKIACAV